MVQCVALDAFHDSLFLDAQRAGGFGYGHTPGIPVRPPRVDTRALFHVQKDKLSGPGLSPILDHLTHKGQPVLVKRASRISAS